MNIYFIININSILFLKPNENTIKPTKNTNKLRSNTIRRSSLI